MPILRTRLILSADVTAETKDETQTYTPSGDCKLVAGSVSAAYDLNCYVGITFDGVILWHGKGGEVLVEPIEIAGDGVKVVKLVLSAEDLTTGSALLGGDLLFEEEV